MVLAGLEKIGAWRFPQDRFILEKDVLFTHTNAFGNVYFARYIEWQGEAREKFLLSHPSAKSYLQASSDVLLITHSLQFDFHESAFFGDTVRIEVQSRNIQKYSFILSFKYYKEKKLVGAGWQKICFQKAGMICEIPQIFLDLILPVISSD